LVCLQVVLSSVPPYAVLEDLADELQEVAAWLHDVMHAETDKTCRVLMRDCLLMLREVLLPAPVDLLYQARQADRETDAAKGFMTLRLR
jgi:hypothetical protein